MAIQFSSGRIENGELVVTPIRTLEQSDIRACPHVIMMPEHYRTDGSCRCNSPDHTSMADWGYVWDGAAWVAPDDED